jgi:hypothetical protein
VLACAAVGAATLLACDAGLPLPGIGGAWIRHTIDDSLTGADGVRLGDADDDGRLDLVVAWEESGAVVVYLNPGPGAVRLPWPSVEVGAVASAEDAVFVDLDSDGALDVVSCAEGSNRGIYVHWAPRDPLLRMLPAAWVTEVIPATRRAQDWMFCTSADIDGRNGVDLIAGGKESGGQVGWLESPSSPRNLGGWRWHGLRQAGWTMSLIAEDVDEDGDTDIVGTDRKGDRRGVFWLANPGPTSAATQAWVDRSLSVFAETAMFADVADVDGDGLRDVLAVTWDRELLVYLKRATQPVNWTARRLTLPRTFGRGKGVRVADVDLDGQLDAAFTTEEAGDKTGVGWLPVARALAGEVALTRGISGERGDKFDLVQAVDLDADGDLDLITTEESAGLGVVWYENPAR